MRIGIAAMNFSQPGDSGGLNVYVRGLVEALGEFDRSNSYYIFLYDYGVQSWGRKAWPAHIRLVALRRGIEFGPGRRCSRLLQKLTGRPTRSHEQEVAAQIDQLKLNLIHFPATTIWPLSVRTPCLLTLFDLQHEYYPEFFAVTEAEARSRTYRASVRKAARIIAPSSYTAQSLIDKYNVEPSRLFTIPAGIGSEWRRAAEVEVARVRQKYHLPAEYLYYPANPWPHKNHERLLAALSICQERCWQVPLLVTTGRLRNESRSVAALADAAGLGSRVIDLGFVSVDDLAGLYSGATALVFPSLFEGFGLPLLEAMACGCPIAAANATAIPDCVGEAALLFDPNDPEAIAEALLAISTNERLRETLAGRGFARVREYHWQRIVPQLTEAYAAMQ